MPKEAMNPKALEALVDAHGLTEVVDVLVQICYDKAEHIRTNWQDQKLAQTWDQAGQSVVNPKVEHPFPS